MPSESSPTAGQKRKSQSDDAEVERPIKHRASLACQSCRTRKVRCDVLANGTRCTNCRLDRFECVVLPSRRGKTSRSRPSIDVQPTPSNKLSQTPKAGSDTTKDDASHTPASATGEVPACVSFDDEPDNDDSNEPLVRDLPTGSGTGNTHNNPYAGLLTPEIRPDTINQQPNAHEGVALPLFVEPLSTRILIEDLEYLEGKGALTVPESDVQVEILRAYLFSVHPFMPMLDYRTFVHAVLSNGEDGQVSLLLFQAVMFAGLHSLQPSVIHRLGFESPKQARGVFFNRVRLLYEFDVEPDIGAVLQSLILMSSWYSKWDGRRDTWHWTGLAYDVARRMGLHRESPSRCTSDKAHRFRKRLWWSLYIRDRMIALGTRRPMRIQDEDFDVSMLALEDFDIEPFEQLYHGQPIIPEARDSRLTALMCIQLAGLCRIIGRVVKSQYTMIRSQQDQIIPHTVMVVSRRDEASSRALQKCDKELNNWNEALSSNVEYIGSNTGLCNSSSCSDVHWAMLVMTQQTTINVLHRAQALKPITDTEEARSVQAISRCKVKDSARSLTRLSQNMLKHDQVRFLGLIGVTALIATYLSHTLDIGSADEDVRDAATFRLHQSLEVLHSLRQIYASADAAITFLSSVSRKAGISVPVFAVEPMKPAVTDVLLSTRNKTHAANWRDTAGSPNGQPGTQGPTWDTPSSNIATQLENTAFQHQRLGSEGQVLTPGDLMSTNAFSMPFQSGARSRAQDWASPTIRTRAYNSPQFIDTTLGTLSNSTEGISIFDWDGGIDFGLDIAPMPFNYDFYSDGLGLVGDRS